MKKYLSMMIQSGLLLAALGMVVQLGRILERLDHVEDIAAEYIQVNKMQGTVSRDEYMELRDFHVRNGDL